MREEGTLQISWLQYEDVLIADGMGVSSVLRYQLAKVTGPQAFRKQISCFVFY